MWASCTQRQSYREEKVDENKIKKEKNKHKQ